MIVPVEKPGSPAEVLEHFGKKGMKWGVRNKSSTRTPMSKKKKVAIGVGAAAVIAGAAFIGYKLHTSGHLKIPTSQITPHVNVGKGRVQKWDGEPFMKLKIGSPEWDRFHKMLFENPGGIDYPTR